VIPRLTLPLPPSRRLLLLRIGCGLVCLLLAVMGCGGEDGAGPTVDGTTVTVAVRDRDDGSPQGAVKVLLMEADANRLWAGPLITDAAGEARFAGVPAGHYKLLAYPGGGRGLYHLPESFRLATADGSNAPPALHLEVITWVGLAFADQLPRISGLVVDGESGEPLAGAFIGPPGALTAYTGAYSVREDVTGPDGAFHVADITFAQDPVSGRPIQVMPLLVSREGYVPTAWFHDPRPQDDRLDIEGVRIALTPLDGSETCELGGRVLSRGQPVAGLPVGVVYLAGPETGGGAAAALAGAVGKGGSPDDPTSSLPLGQPGLSGHSGITDESGEYHLTGLVPGWYLTHPAYQDDDGYLAILTAMNPPVRVTEEAPGEVADIEVMPTLSPLVPPPGAILPDTLRTFTWTAVAAADSYLVFLDRIEVATVGTARYALPPEDSLSPGSHTWLVTALDGQGEAVAIMDAYKRFFLLPADER
jgi:hypothetical protein